MTTGRNGHCPEDTDFYTYLTRSPEERVGSALELHVSKCPSCRQKLAELLRMLNPEPEAEAMPDPTPREIQDTLALISQVSGQELKNRRLYRWGGIAAAAVIAVCLGSAGFVYMYVRAKSQSFYGQAQALLQEVYEPRSPSDLRLDLPFTPASSQRTVTAGSDEALNGAERFFNQAIGVREGMSEALLGLGYLKLRKNQFSKAAQDFQTILNANPQDTHALIGRGVSRFEEGLVSADPSLRNRLLKEALDDFQSVLKLQPGSIEARYNKIQVLYYTGRHKEALAEINSYLASDPGSIWAIKVRDLRVRIEMNRSELLEKEVTRAARAHDEHAIQTLVRIVPEKTKVIFIALLRKALACEGQPGVLPDASTLQWAARSLAAAYQNTMGDLSCSRLLEFYGGLSPPDKKIKRALDARLEQAITSFNRSNFPATLRDSDSLIRDYENLKDYWQLVRAYQLRGTCFYYGKADFSSAATEYGKMLHYADLTGDPDLIARSLAALATSSNERHEYDAALAYSSRLKQLAEQKHLNEWTAFAHSTLGATYYRLNSLDESVKEYLSALILAYQSMDPTILLSSLEYLGDLLKRTEQLRESANFYREAEQWLQNFQREGIIGTDPATKTTRLNLLTKQGYLALDLRDWESAESHFNKALKDPFNGMHELEARIRLGLAQAFIQETRFTEAKSELQTISRLAGTKQYPEISWRASTLQGILKAQAGDYHSSIANFQRAVDTLEKMRGKVSSLELRQSFFDQRYDPYREMVSLILHKENNPEKALACADRAKAITLGEYLGSESYSGRQLPGQGTDLPRQITMLEYFLAADELIVFVSGPAGTVALPVSFPIYELKSLVRQYAESIRKNDGPVFAALSKKLYAVLVEPARPKFGPPGNILVVVPDGFLNLVPFGSLMGSDGHFLLETSAISYAPSRTILRYCLSLHKTVQFNRQTSILLLTGGYNLPGANQEIARLANLYPRSKLLEAQGIPSISSNVENYEIVHFSGHAILSHGRPQLVFSTPKGDTYLDATAIQNWNMPRNLLCTLAGCNTGIGPISDGETPWGLVPALIKAGAPAMLVSLFAADDIATGKLTSEFYALLAEGKMSKAQALRQAQLSLLNSLGPRASQTPLSWSSFVLIGDPR
jgi:CHAT domain-containing protein